MSRTTFFLAAFLLTLHPLVAAEAEAELRESVAAYWNSLQSHDFYAALQHVEPDSRNRFIQRKREHIRDWRLEGIELVGEDQARVTVSVERYLAATREFLRVRHSQVWLFAEGRWGVRIPQVTSADVSRILTGSSRRRAPRDLPETIQIAPRRIEMPFLNPVQMGSVVIQNGLDTTVRVAEIEFDADRFELVRRVETIEPGQQGRLTLRYQGDEEEKDLTSSLRFRLHLGDESHPVEIPVLYNHVDRTTRVFFGLSDEDVKNLRRGDPLTPKIRLDPGNMPPPVDLPVDADEEDSDGEEPPR
jgi:hypothetical protein